MDELTYSFLYNLRPKNISLYSIQDVEEHIKGLKLAKKNRNKVEYFFTCSPAICKYVILKNENIKSITYLDADLYFLSSPQIVFDEIGEHSIAIIEHRFHWLTKRQIKYGKYNVGWITFKNDFEGIKCLDKWVADCLAWCYQKVEKKRFGDQKYLDEWPALFKNLIVVKNIGANVAIWNIKNYKLSVIKDKIFIDNVPLVFYDFANIHQIDNYRFNTNLSRVLMPLKGILKEKIYLPYLKNLHKNLNETYFTHKTDQHISGIKKQLIQFSRKLRTLIFNDIIDIRE